jgi:hypothetical protein
VLGCKGAPGPLAGAVSSRIVSWLWTRLNLYFMRRHTTLIVSFGVAKVSPSHPLHRMTRRVAGALPEGADARPNLVTCDALSIVRRMCISPGPSYWIASSTRFNARLMNITASNFNVWQSSEPQTHVESARNGWCRILDLRSMSLCSLPREWEERVC